MPMTLLYHAHSGLRYLVLLAAVLVVFHAGFSFFSRWPDVRAGRVMMSIFVGVLDLQILLGILLVLGGIYYPMLIGHLSLMALAAVAAHLFAIRAQKAPDAALAHRNRLIGVLLALALIVAGIYAIDRTLFETRAPMLVFGLL
jgi:hypothetical protein